MTQGVGLSVGATKVAAVIPGCAAVTRQSVLTVYRHRPPEVGVPAENSRLDERGLVLTDFVDRAADPVGIMAADGSFHRGETLIADALRALTYTATAGRSPVSPPGVAFPAHWRAAAVEALRRELVRLPEWSARPERLTRSSRTPRRRSAHCRPNLDCPPGAWSRSATSAAPAPASRWPTPPTATGRSARRYATTISPESSSTGRCSPM